MQIGYAQSGKNYPVELSNEKMYVNVPWENTTYSDATQSAAGLMSAADKTKLDGMSQGTMREVPFTIETSAWSASGGNYVANFNTAYVTTSSKEIITYDVSYRSARADVIVAKKSGGGGLTFTTRQRPDGALSGTAYVWDNSDGKIPVIIEGTVVPIANGGTGQSSLAGAQQVLGITELNSNVATLNRKFTWITLSSEATTNTIPNTAVEAICYVYKTGTTNIVPVNIDLGKTGYYRAGQWITAQLGFSATIEYNATTRVVSLSQLYVNGANETSNAKMKITYR